VNFFNPWIFLRMLAGLTTACLFLRGAFTSWRVLRHFDIGRASEGQLALERQTELVSTFVRVGSVAQIGALALTVVVADRLSGSVRGAMCAYGVFQADPWGFTALDVTMTVALAAGVTSQLCALDRGVRGMELVRPLALASIVMAPLAIADLITTALFFLHLDLGVVASCCSTQLDADVFGEKNFASGPRQLAAIGAPVAVLLSAALGWAASLRPRAAIVAVAAAASIAALPLALGAAILEVAPYAFELPQHSCPFCLLRRDVFGLGYPLFGAIFLAVVWSVGAALGTCVTRSGAMAESVSSFIRGRLRREAVAWLVAFAIGVVPVVRYVLVADGRPLFP
jgi:hypothetical protein